MYFVYIQIPVYDAAYMYEIKTGLYRMLSWSPVCNKPIRNNYSLVQSNCSLIGFLTAIAYSAMYIIHETAVTGKDCLFPPKNYVIYMNNTTLNCMMHFQADNFSTYNRLFHQRNGYDSKIHRDDRNHILKIGRAVHDEVSVSLFVGPVYHVFYLISYVF